MKWKGLPVLIMGSGGISKETYNLLKEINFHNRQDVFEFLGFVEAETSQIGESVIDGYKVITSDENLDELLKSYIQIGIIVPIGSPRVKKKIVDSLLMYENVIFPNLIHPTVAFDKALIRIGYGNIITSGVILTCDIEIGKFNLININSTVGHDAVIGNYNVINPLVAISGGVHILGNSLVGTGAKILQNIEVGIGATIGAGAVVTKNVVEMTTVVGIPAKSLK